MALLLTYRERDGGTCKPVRSAEEIVNRCHSRQEKSEKVNYAQDIKGIPIPL